MIAKRELRVERNDVISFWVEKKVLNELDEIIIIEEKVDECTLNELEKLVDDFEKQIVDLQKKIIIEREKITLCENL